MGFVDDRPSRMHGRFVLFRSRAGWTTICGRASKFVLLGGPARSAESRARPWHPLHHDGSSLGPAQRAWALGPSHMVFPVPTIVCLISCVCASIEKGALLMIQLFRDLAVLIALFTAWTFRFGAISNSLLKCKLEVLGFCASSWRLAFV